MSLVETLVQKNKTISLYSAILFLAATIFIIATNNNPDLTTFIIILDTTASISIGTGITSFILSKFQKKKNNTLIDSQGVLYIILGFPVVYTAIMLLIMGNYLTLLPYALILLGAWLSLCINYLDMKRYERSTQTQD